MSLTYYTTTVYHIDVAVDVVTTPMLRAWKKQHKDAVKAGIITKLTARSHQYARSVESVVVNGFGMKPGARFTLGRVNFVEECGKLSADIIWKLMCFFSRGFMADLSSKVSKRSYSIEISIRDGDVSRTLKRFWPGNDDSKACNCDVLNDLMRVKSFFNAILIDVMGMITTHPNSIGC